MEVEKKEQALAHLSYFQQMLINVSIIVTFIVSIYTPRNRRWLSGNHTCGDFSLFPLDKSKKEDVCSTV